MPIPYGWMPIGVVFIGVLIEIAWSVRLARARYRHPLDVCVVETMGSVAMPWIALAVACLLKPYGI